MGFSGGGSNVTKAHTHSSSIVQDGGELNFNNVTQAGMAAGDITYSNGTALQILNLGSATDTLTVNSGATAPEWAAGGGAGGNMVFIERFTASASDTFTCSLASAIDLADFTTLTAIFNGRYDTSGTGNLEMQIATNNQEPIDESRYSSMQTDLTPSSSASSTSNIDNWTVGSNTGGTGVSTQGTIYMEITVPDITGGGAGGQPSNIYIRWQQIGRTEIQSWAGGITYDNIGAVTDIRGFYFTNSAGNNFDAASTCDIYKLTR